MSSNEADGRVNLPSETPDHIDDESYVTYYPEGAPPAVARVADPVFRARYEDLLSDYSSSDSFLVDGDALLLSVLSGIRQAHSAEAWQATDGQTLHVIYQMEHLLYQFHTRNARVELVFFAVNRALWTATPVQAAIREIALQHFRGTRIPVLEFSSYNDAGFQAAKERLHPIYHVLYDGAMEDAALRGHLRGYLHTVLAARQHVVYLSDMTFNGKRINGFAIRATREVVVKAAQSLQAQTAAQIIQNATVPAAQSADVASAASARLALHAQALRDVANDSKPLAWAWLAHVAVLEAAPIAARAQRGAPVVPAAAATFVNHVAAALLKRLLWLADNETPALKSTLCDLFDLRLFYLIAARQAAHANLQLGVPAASQSAFLEALRGLGLPDAAPQGTGVTWTAAAPSEAAADAFLPTQAPLLAALIANNALPASVTSVPTVANEQLERQLTEARAYDEVYPFHAGKELDDEIADEQQNESTIDRETAQKSEGFQWWCEREKDRYMKGYKDSTYLPVRDGDPEEIRKVQERMLQGYIQNLLNKRERGRQQYARFLQRYAESLEGHKDIHQRPIPSVGGLTTVLATVKPKREEKAHAKEAKKKEPKKADLIKAENAIRMKEKELADLRKQWDGKERMLSGESDARAIDNMKSFMKEVDDKLEDSFPIWKRPAFACVQRLYKMWQQECFKTGDRDTEVAANVLRLVYEIRRRAALAVASAAASSAAAAAEPVASTSSKKAAAKKPAAAPAKPAAKGKAKAAKEEGPIDDDEGAKITQVLTEMGFQGTPENNRYVVGLSEIRFQLTHMGHMLERVTDGQPDPRVGFVPDAWQIQLLDIVDRRESAVVCAPTSSGKTFISYYCMEQVLVESDDGVVVYVAPTKALVNQVAAEVYARLRKKYDKSPSSGRSVYGIFTADYHQNDPVNCQVLVTVPECLEILLLSPSHTQWRKRVRYVIFDEVHNISLQEEGAVWERLLELVRCPFLALSATVGNPGEFQQWLGRAQALQERQAARMKVIVEAEGGAVKKSGKRGGDVTEKPLTHYDFGREYRTHLIHHTERYSDLQKYVFVPPSQDPPPPLKSLHGAEGLENLEARPIHPYAALLPTKLKDGVPASLSLTPKEMLTLYDTMAACCEGVSSGPIAAFIAAQRPEQRFAAGTLITKRQAREYERDLRAQLEAWARDPTEAPRAARVLERIRQPMLELEGLPATLESLDPFWRRRHALELVRLLKKNKWLPALVFCLQRSQCEALASDMTLELEALEAKNESDPERRAAREKLEKERERRARAARRTRDKGDDKKGEAPEDVEPDVEGGDVGLPDVDPASTLVREGEGYTKAAFDEMVTERFRKLDAEGWSRDHVLLRACLRGIGVHHAGLPKKYRELVEILFRHGHIKVVIATGTLAQGIHMPCRAVVFAGDSPQLDPLNFHQMSGRAGRRGYDELGHVVFYGVPWGKISSLMTADVPTLRGSFPLSTTLVLRLMQLQDRMTSAEDKAVVVDFVESLLAEPLICLDQPTMREQVSHHFRFALEYLQRQRVTDPAGRVVGLAGLAAHLHWSEPTNWVVLKLLTSDALATLCKYGEPGRTVEDAAKDLCRVLSYLFVRTPIHNAIQAPAPTADEHSTVVLPPVHACVSNAAAGRDLENILSTHRDEAAKAFTTYLRLFANTLGAHNNTLPISGVALPGAAGAAAGDSLIGDLTASRAVSVACSPFVALTGQDDHFSSARQLSTCVRSDVYVDDSAIPFANTDVALNAFVSDFFEHGEKQALIKVNGLREGDAWQLLKDFSTDVTALNAAAVKMTELRVLQIPLDVRCVLAELETSFGKKFAAFNQV